jgi:excisionase family DNA binding protein
MYDEPYPDRWLSLSEASALLGVHASTLRRWADSGRVPCQRTPGGHRRFNRRKLMQIIEGTAPEGADAEARHPSEYPWHKSYARAGLVDSLRETGQRLSGVLVQYLMRHDDDDRHLKEGYELGQRYAAESLKAGIGLMDALEAFVFYRARFIDMLGQMPDTDTASATRQFARYDRFMSQVLLGLVTTYEKG